MSWVASQVRCARAARCTSAVSALRVLWKTVSKTTRPSRRQPIRHPGLPAEQVEPQLADLRIEVAGVRLTECLGTLGEQADEEVDPAEVAVGEALQPGPHLWLDLDFVQIGHASNDICISRYGQPNCPAGATYRWGTGSGDVGVLDNEGGAVRCGAVPHGIVSGRGAGHHFASGQRGGQPESRQPRPSLVPRIAATASSDPSTVTSAAPERP